MAKQETQTKYHRRRNGVLFTILAVILIAASVVAACTVFFRVETVTVEGTARYTTEEILSVANVEMGANMILTPGEQIAQRIYEALPYVDEVDVQKQFPTTINLKITETQAAMVLQGTASRTTPHGSRRLQTVRPRAQALARPAMTTCRTSQTAVPARRAAPGALRSLSTLLRKSSKIS